jgi:uncharacterized membrane protein YdjX (TVP38/TMEM64 family)
MGGKVWRRLAVAGGAVCLVAAAAHLGLCEYLTFAHFKAAQAAIAGLYAGHAPAVLAAYVLVYVLITALCLPGTSLMNVVGAGAFGLWTGFTVICLARGLGAVAACVLTRTFLRDRVRRLYGRRLDAINGRLEAEGALYLFLLRSVPGLPFPLVNVAAGLTSMALSTVFLVTLAGSAPPTLIMANAYARLVTVDSVGAVFTPRIFLSLALIGVIPLVLRRAYGLLRPRPAAVPVPVETGPAE